MLNVGKNIMLNKQQMKIFKGLMRKKKIMKKKIKKMIIITIKGIKKIMFFVHAILYNIYYKI